MADFGKMRPFLIGFALIWLNPVICQKHAAIELEGDTLFFNDQSDFLPAWTLDMNPFGPAYQNYRKITSVLDLSYRFSDRLSINGKVNLWYKEDADGGLENAVRPGIDHRSSLLLDFTLISKNKAKKALFLRNSLFKGRGLKYFKNKSLHTEAGLGTDVLHNHFGFYPSQYDINWDGMIDYHFDYEDPDFDVEGFVNQVNSIKKVVYASFIAGFSYQVRKNYSGKYKDSRFWMSSSRKIYVRGGYALLTSLPYSMDNGPFVKELKTGSFSFIQPVNYFFMTGFETFFGFRSGDGINLKFEYGTYPSYVCQDYIYDLYLERHTLSWTSLKKSKFYLQLTLGYTFKQKLK